MKPKHAAAAAVAALDATWHVAAAKAPSGASAPAPGPTTPYPY